MIIYIYIYYNRYIYIYIIYIYIFASKITGKKGPGTRHSLGHQTQFRRKYVGRPKQRAKRTLGPCRLLADAPSDLSCYPAPHSH